MAIGDLRVDRGHCHSDYRGKGFGGRKRSLLATFRLNQFVTLFDFGGILRSSVCVLLQAFRQRPCVGSGA